VKARRLVSAVAIIELPDSPSARWEVRSGSWVEQFPHGMAALQAVRDRDAALATGEVFTVTVVTWEPCTAAGRAVAKVLTGGGK